MNPTRDLSTERAGSITEYLNTVLRPAWQFDWWPETMTVEARRWRDTYAAGEFLSAGNERFHTGSNAYYLALREQAAATEPPATYSAGVWTLNSAWWARCATGYSALPQVSGEALAVGDLRQDIETGLFYQIHTAHTASSATVDVTKAGELIPFARHILFEQTGRTPLGTVKGMHQHDPRVFPRLSGKLNHTLNSRGVLVSSISIPATVWVEFRLRAPKFTSTPWAQPASGSGYDVNDLVYYDGGVFKSLIGDNEAALDNTEQWEYIGFPEWLADHCKLAAAALLLTDQKQTSRANDLRMQAQNELERVREQEITSQQEPEMAEVRTC
jgi:hypothetical protein